MTKSKRKLLISMLVMMFVLLSAVAVVAIAFALTQQTITTTLNISFTATDIKGTASATYTIGSTTKNLKAKKGDTTLDNDVLTFDVDAESSTAGSLVFPEDQINLSSANDNIVIKYTYTNSGERHYIASMDFDTTKVTQTNMKIEYSKDGSTYSTDRYALVVKGINGTTPGTNSYYIKISILDKSKNASFAGDFNWLLNGCDDQTDDYQSLASLDLTANTTDNTYSASISATNVGEYVVFPSEINGSPVTTIEQNSNLTDTQKQQVKTVYIPDSVTLIDGSSFSGYSNLATVTFEQNETTTGTSAQSTSTGLKKVEHHAFAFCSSLKSIKLPDTITVIGEECFIECSLLEEVVLPNNLILLYGYAFYNCPEITEITIPASVKLLGAGMLGSCKKLNRVIFENTEGWHHQGSLYGSSNFTNPETAAYNMLHKFTGALGRDEYKNW